MNSEAAQSFSIVSGPPLSDEPGLGTLTLPGFLRDVTSMYGDREVLVFRAADGDTRWTYIDLWERAVEVACALRACGVGKDTRVGVLMTNRPEWISAFFGISLAGGVAVTLSTFSTPSELEYLLNASCVAVLLFERKVLKTDFAVVLSKLAPEIGTTAPGALQSEKFPFLRHLATVGEAPSGIDTWDAFLARGHDEPHELVHATAEAACPERCGSAVLLVGLDEQAKRCPQRASRRRHPDVALPENVRFRAGRQSPLLVCERFLLVRQFRDVAGRHARRRRLPCPATDVPSG